MKKDVGGGGMYNVRLAKLIGVHQTLAGRNAYHVTVRLTAAYLIAIAAVMTANAAYYSSERSTEAALYFGSAVLLVYQCYKVRSVVGRWTDVRDCMRIAGPDFAAGSGRCSVVARERPDLDRRVVRATDAYAVAGVLFAVMYAASPLPFLGTYNAMPAANGSVGLYRPGVLNLYAGLSAHAYNAHYTVIYAVEVLCAWAFMFFVVFYDTILIMLCVALTRRLRDVATAFRSVGRAADPGDKIFATDDRVHSGINNSRNQVMYNDLKSIISYHQAVMMTFEKLFSVYQPLILSQIVISSINIVLIWYTMIAKYFDAKAHKTGEGAASTMARMVCSCPFMSFQLVLTCYLFESLHHHKESIIFALYESNWMDMDIKCRNLILFTMRLNNAHKQKMKFSRLRVVNMEMIFTVIRVCYSVLSMLMNVKTRSIK